jgi:transposase-like protein
MRRGQEPMKPTFDQVIKVLYLSGEKRLNLDIRQRVVAVGRRVHTLCQGEDVSDVLIWYCLRTSLDPLPSTRPSDIMIIQVLHCPHCQGTAIVRYGNTRQGKQRYRCRACRQGRGRTFLLDYSYAGQSPEIKEQIVEMAMNASGIRDIARVLHVSTNTVMTELKKRNLNLNR